MVRGKKKRRHRRRHILRSGEAAVVVHRPSRTFPCHVTAKNIQPRRLDTESPLACILYRRNH